MKISCDVVMDLIPLVNDGVASNESVKIVNDHCSECKNCRKLLDIKPEINPPDEKIIKSIKKSLILTQGLIALIGLMLGIWFTASSNMFYNFYIMPIVGAICYIIFKKKSFLAPIFIIILTQIIALIKIIPNISEIFTITFNDISTFLLGNLFFGIIYAVLALVGIIIALLLSFAFRRERNEK